MVQALVTSSIKEHSVIPALKKQKQESEFENNLGYIARHCLKKTILKRTF
jgi:hypothetical protein